MKFLGPEFPAIFAALVGLMLTTLTAKKGFLIPTKIWLFNGEEKLAKSTSNETHVMPLWLAWAPYLLVVMWWVLTRLDGLG